MPQPGTVARHPHRDQINAALVAGVPNRRVAAQYGLSEAAVRRHKAHHLPVTLAKAAAAQEVTRADELLAELNQLKRKAISVLLKAEAAGDYRTALAGIREARASVELLLEVEGEINRNPQINVLIASPAWQQTRDAIIRALAPYAEARDAVVKELRTLEGE